MSTTWLLAAAPYWSVTVVVSAWATPAGAISAAASKAAPPATPNLRSLRIFSCSPSNPVGRDPLVDAGTSRASGATASSQGVCSLFGERIPALGAMINRDIPGEARLGQLP